MNQDRGVLATSDEIAAAYLEWLDTTDDDLSREALLITARRAESDCLNALEELRALAGKVRALQLH